MCVGVGNFIYWQILPFISLDVWFSEGFDSIYIYIYIYIYTTNLLCHKQLCLMMFNERYCIVYYAINLLYYKHWIGKWKYITHISVTRKVLKSCRIKIVTLAHDVHGASSLYIKPCWQSLYRVFPPGGMGKSPHQPKICSCTPSQPNIYSPPPPPKVN